MSPEPELKEINGDSHLPATKGDVNELAALVANTMASKEDLKNLATKDEFRELEGKVSALSDKTDRIERVAQSILTTVQTLEERTRNHPERLDRLEKKAFGFTT